MREPAWAGPTLPGGPVPDLGALGALGSAVSAALNERSGRRVTRARALVLAMTATRPQTGTRAAPERGAHRAGRRGVPAGPDRPAAPDDPAIRDIDGNGNGNGRTPPRPAPGPERRPEVTHPPPHPDPDSDDDGDAATAEADARQAEHAEMWALVHRAQDGDGEAFGELYDRYVEVVFRFVYYRVNDRALAEDFTSETFVRALRRIGSISYQGRDIGAWFVTIARNIVLDHVKSARHRLEVTTADTFEGPTREPSTEKAVLDTLAAEELMAAVRQLGDEQRECVTLRFIQGLSVSETASAMGKNDGAIKALQHRAVRKLADLVSSDLR